MFVRLFIILTIASCVSTAHGQSRLMQNRRQASQSARPVHFSLNDASLAQVDAKPSQGEISVLQIRQATWQESVEPLENKNADLTRRRSELDAQDRSDNKSEATQDDYQLPQLARVSDPISLTPLSQIYQKDPSDLLAKPTHQELIAGELETYANLTGTDAIPSCAHWAAPNFYHRPLLFEETNLERYGNRHRHQNLASAAHFLVSIPTLPYHLRKHPKGYREYTLKHRRPGDCVPYEVDRLNFSLRGGFWQALATAAIVIP